MTASRRARSGTTSPRTGCRGSPTGYQGQAIIRLASDPLGHGADYFGTAQNTINYTWIGATGIWYVQVGALVMGHVAGLVLAHDRAIAIYDDPRTATRSQYWMLGVMICFTCLALYLPLGGRPMTKNIIMLVVAASLLASCGGGKDTTKGALPKSSALRSQLERSTASSTADFPAVKGRTLNDLTDELTATGTRPASTASASASSTARTASSTARPPSTSPTAPTDARAAPSPRRQHRDVGGVQAR